MKYARFAARRDLRFKILCLISILSLISYLLSQDKLTYADTLNGGAIQLQIEETTPTPTPPENSSPTPPPPVSLSIDGGSISIGQDIDAIDYGPLSPTNPILRILNISASDTAKGFSVFAFEDHPPTASNSAVIEDTACDNHLCQQTNSSDWISTLTYGFGYRCDSIYCSPGFEKDTFYKQFANNGNGKFPERIMASRQPGSIAGRITFKLNISGTQDLSVPYQNTVTFISLPNL
jgi:hypothetical protein